MRRLAYEPRPHPYLQPNPDIICSQILESYLSQNALNPVSTHELAVNNCQWNFGLYASMWVALYVGI